MMAPDPTTPAGQDSKADTLLRRLLGGMSIFTLVLTVSQVWTIWIAHQASGVSVLSWSGYLLSAALWFWDAVRICSLGQITNALFEVGGQYRRNM
jgi:hypothetical protein